jgi:hypothetical protein
VGSSIDGRAFTFASGWSFYADLRDDAGLVLKKVRHADNSFATDMRVVKVYVFPGEPDKFGVYQTSSYVLGGRAVPDGISACTSVDRQIQLEMPNASLIRPYNPAEQLSATFEAAPATKGGQKIIFKQSMYLPITTSRRHTSQVG